MDPRCFEIDTEDGWQPQGFEAMLKKYFMGFDHAALAQVVVGDPVGPAFGLIELRP